MARHHEPSGYAPEMVDADVDVDVLIGIEEVDDVPVPAYPTAEGNGQNQDPLFDSFTAK